MKRRILAALLAVCAAVSLLALPAGAANTSSVTFRDVNDKDTAVAVEVLRLMGVLDGYGDGTFRPGTALNRAQFCKMVVYAMNGQDELGRYRTVTVFPDVKPSHWAASYINMAAKGKGVIAGYADGKFHPDQTITLGQAVTILLRLLDYKDEQVGGVWPDSYMAVAASIGLTDGLGANGGGALTRGQAAKLFLNLLRTDKREGGAYVTTLENVTTVSNSMLVSSTADGPDGRGKALQLANGSVYSLRDGKMSSGALNGYKGTLVLTKNGGKAITFVPDSIGTSKVITLASAKANQLTDTMGVIYTMDSKVKVSVAGGSEEEWGSAYKWLTAGTSLTLYLNDAGEVEYVYQGGGATSNKAVVVYTKGSTAGFDSLTGGINNYSIYKNGSPAAAGDLRPYDVAVYNGASNAVRVCDTRVSVYYEACYPSPTEPETIEALGGTEFKVLPTAQESLSKFRPGDRVILLLSEDGQVAGALDAESGAARGNALGIVQSGKVQLLCGNNKVALNASGTEKDGQLVRVSSEKKGTVALSRVTGGAGGDLDVVSRKLGNKSLAEGVMIFENGADVSLSNLSNRIIPASQILYARTNWAGDVDLVVLGDSSSATVYYGRAKVTTGDSSPVWVPDDGHQDDPPSEGHGHYAEKDGKTYLTVEFGNGEGDSVGPIVANYSSIRTGDFVAATVNSKKTAYTSVTLLKELSDVPNSAWSGKTAVTAGGRTYTVSADVPCYDRSTKSWLDLDTARTYADKANLFVSDGIVRAIEIN